MRIDVHAHYYPKRYVDLLVALGRADLAPLGAGQSDDLTSRIETLDAARTDVQILSSVALDTFLPGAEQAARACRAINDEYAAASAKYRGRFGAFGQVPLPHVDEALAEATRCLDELGFQGICTPCFYAGEPLDAPRFAPLWQELDRRRSVLYVHPVGTHSICHFGLKEFGLHTAWGSPLQLSATATRLVYSGFTRRYPQLNVIFAVCGGYLPFWWQRIETNLRRGLTGSANSAVGSKMFAWVKQLGLDPDDPMSEFRRFWYDTSVQDVPLAMAAVKRAYGVERLLLGSDEIFASLIEAVRYIENDEFLTPEEKRRVLDENAQSLLCLPAGRARWA